MNPLWPAPHPDAAAIVRASGSSFGPAFRLLPRDRRKDLETLYAFCRTADDIADAGDYPQHERDAALEAWRAGFRDGEMRDLPENLRELVHRRALDRNLFLELLDGTATDLTPKVRMATRADLDLYCHRVAGTVGQLCLPVFGANPQRSAAYAETLGRALQYTNILRDTASDRQRGRIYYPLDELAAAGIDDFPSGAAGYLASFAAQAGKLFDEAAARLPREDRSALRPARVMSAIYSRLLGKMQRNGWSVTEKRCRLSLPEKLLAIGAVLSGRQ
ncbi:MAG: squalene/phytoene synthase family protein [Chthoniobacterales bacterium]|nr:squalene/phytoene synthase family protein [Chthoniobacterales bacterium]